MLALALVETFGQLVVRARVPAPEDWARAAALVREGFEPGDTIVGAPGWVDPILREQLGDLIPAAHAGRSDLAPYARVWEISSRGRTGPWTPEGDPELAQRVGALTVRRWDLGPSPVLVDLVDQLPRAAVTRGDRTCRWRRQAARGGGLFAGPLWPREAHVCGPESWLFVGETVIEDLDLMPRRCVWQHPAGNEPITTRFTDVELGERIVLHAGLYYDHERRRLGVPVDLDVSVNGSSLGRLRHLDGDGWKRAEISIPEALRGERGAIAIAVTSPNPDLRTLCWAATVRGPARSVE